MGYIRQTLWELLWDIFVKSYGIYLHKLCDTLRDIFVKSYGIYVAKLRVYG